MYHRRRENTTMKPKLRKLLLVALLEDNSCVQRHPRSFWVHLLLQGRTQHGEYHQLVMELRLVGVEFQTYFRLDQGQFDLLLSKIGAGIVRIETNYRTLISPAERLAICLRFRKPAYNVLGSLAHNYLFYTAQYTHDKLDEFIEVINAQLQPMFMQIRKGMSEEDGLQYYALVNMAETDVTRMSADYADNELELFRKTMDLIVDSDNGTASSTDILNCADSLQTKKLKKKETEHVLNRLVHDKWLNEKQGEYSLSTRCIMEMEPYIRRIYQDQVKVCHICHNVALQCQMCENPTCGIKIHTHCVARYFKGRTDPRCPSCEDFWPHEIPEVYRPPSSQSQSATMEKTTPTPRATAQTRKTRRS